MTSVTTKIVMSLIEGYAETRHICGRPEYNGKSFQARAACQDAIEALVKASNPPLFDLSKGIPPATGALPTINHTLIPSKEEA